MTLPFAILRRVSLAFDPDEGEDFAAMFTIAGESGATELAAFRVLEKVGSAAISADGGAGRALSYDFDSAAFYFFQADDVY